jgi:hypothetical protein
MFHVKQGWFGHLLALVELPTTFSGSSLFSSRGSVSRRSLCCSQPFACQGVDIWPWVGPFEDRQHNGFRHTDGGRSPLESPDPRLPHRIDDFSPKSHSPKYMSVATEVPTPMGDPQEALNPEFAPHQLPKNPITTPKSRQRWKGIRPGWC